MNTLHLTCDNPDELLAGFGAGARIKIQSSATQAGAYADVTTVALVAATKAYTYEHLAGISTTWYKTRFEDSTGANANDYGAPFQAADATTAYASMPAFDTFLRSASIDADAYTRKLALEAAARAIDVCCGRTFHLATAASARYFTAGISTGAAGWYAQRFAVDIDDVADTTGMIVNFDATGNGAYTTVVTTYRTGPLNAPAKGQPYRSLLFDLGTIPPLNEYGVKVTALWGWAAWPSAVTLANLIQGARFAKRRDSPYGVAGSVEFGNELRLLPKVDPDVAVMLAEYRLDWGNQ